MFVKIVIICLVAVILHHTWKLWNAFVPPAYPHIHEPGPCHLVPGIETGSEDLNMLRDGLVLISSGLRSFGTIDITDEDYPPGRLLLFDFNNPNSVEELVLPSVFDGQRLNPHGISVWQDPHSDVVTIFMVSHHDQESRIQKLHLDLSTHKLTHVTTITDERFIHINDIVASSDTSFYATNEFGTSSWLTRHIELALLTKLGVLLHYDGSSSRVVADNLRLPNGITLSNDARFVYVSEIGCHSVAVYDRNVHSNDLSLVQIFMVHAPCDNVIVDAEGDLWLGCHPQPLKSMDHFKNISSPAPSQVLHLKTKNGLIISMREAYADDGQTLSASSSAIHHDNKLLIGSVRHKLLLCHINTR